MEAHPGQSGPLGRSAFPPQGGFLCRLYSKSGVVLGVIIQLLLSGDLDSSSFPEPS